MEQYFQHLPTCNKISDWSEAQEALSLCPDGIDKETAYEEMRVKMNTCTCGMENCLKATKESLFTPDDIRKVQEQAYEAGFQAGQIGDTITIQ